MELTLLLCVVLARYLVNGWTDAKYAVQGKTPPRYQVKLAKVVHSAPSSSTPAVEGPKRYGAKDYFTDLWHDSWEDARKRRTNYRAKKAKGELRHQKMRAGLMAAFTAGVGQLRDDVRRATEKRRFLRTIPDVSESTRRPVVSEDDEEVLGEVIDTPDLETRPAEPESEPPAQEATGATHQPEADEGPTDDNPPTAEPTPPVAVSAPVRLATVTPITRNSIGKENAMSTQSGETTSLSSALNYTQAYAAECRNGVTSIEQSINTLQERKVKGKGVEILAEAQQKMAELAQLFDSANAEFSKQTVVREAYAAVPEAGDKEFVTAQ